MRTIIRIEHPSDGKGIWRSRDENMKYRIDNLSTFDNFAERHVKFPTPFKENLKMDFECFCGFKSIESLVEWVTPNELKEIVTMGFKVLLLDVSKCQVGEFQIIFKKKFVKQTKDITELFI